MSDFDLVGGEVSPLGAGRSVRIAWMKGRSRGYTLTVRNGLDKSAISVVLNDRCEMIVATVVLPHDRPAMIEPDVMEFLNSRTVLHWAEGSSRDIELGYTTLASSVGGRDPTSSSVNAKSYLPAMRQVCSDAH
jgi:hypothetical protein